MYKPASTAKTTDINAVVICRLASAVLLADRVVTVVLPGAATFLTGLADTDFLVAPADLTALVAGFFAVFDFALVDFLVVAMPRV